MINKVTLIGRLGKDPEVRHFDNNSSVCNFTLATSESYNDKQGNRIEQTEWHNISVWRKGLVDVAEKYLGKGQLVYIEGKLRTRKWEDQNGNNRYTTEVVAENFKMLERKDANSGSTPEQQTHTEEHKAKHQEPTSTTDSSSNNTVNSPDETDDLPF